MKKALVAFVNALPLLMIALALLGAAVALGYTGKFSSTATFSIIMGLVGVMGVTSVAILVTAIPNVNLVTHMVFTIFLMVGVVVLVVHNVFSYTQIDPLLLLIIGSGGAGAGVHQMTKVVQTIPSTVGELAAMPGDSGMGLPATGGASPTVSPLPASADTQAATA